MDSLMKPKIKKYVKAIIFFIILLFFAACSFSKPNIPEISVKVLKIETEDSNLAERLSVFLKYEDENGRNDYSSITVVHLESAFTWVLNRENSSFFSSSQLKSSDVEKTLWIGSNKIADPFGKIPLGEYSIIAEDSAGNRTVQKNSIKETESLAALPFVFQIQNKAWDIEFDQSSNFKNFSLILLGADKQPIFAEILPYSFEYKGTLDSLLEKYPDARYVQCMAQNAQGSEAYLTKSFNLY